MVLPKPFHERKAILKADSENLLESIKDIRSALGATLLYLIDNMPQSEHLQNVQSKLIDLGAHPLLGPAQYQYMRPTFIEIGGWIPEVQAICDDLSKSFEAHCKTLETDAASLIKTRSDISDAALEAIFSMFSEDEVRKLNHMVEDFREGSKGFHQEYNKIRVFYYEYFIGVLAKINELIDKIYDKSTKPDGASRGGRE